MPSQVQQLGRYPGESLNAQQKVLSGGARSVALQQDNNNANHNTVLGKRQCYKQTGL